jgi:thioredoxin-related protein
MMPTYLLHQVHPWAKPAVPVVVAVLLTLSLLLLPHSPAAAANTADNELAFDDQPLAEALHLPDWFNLSFLDLNESLEEALSEGKKGLIIYFGRKDCAYCKALLEDNWGDPAIARYTQRHFNVIAIEVRGSRTVTDFTGKKWSEKDYSTAMRTNFTPTLLFYNKQGQLALKLPGYRPKYQFRAALEYVADAHYARESFRDYLARAESALSFGLPELNDHDVFQSPPYNLNRSHIRHSQSLRPLMVFFEHPRCHACDVLHGDTLSNPQIEQQLRQLDVVQLNTHNNTPVITPDGRKTTASAWADKLDLTFAPALLFFDEKGNEILRIESVIRFYRLNKVLEYITGKHYLRYPTFQIWLQHSRNKRDASEQETGS